MNTQNRNRLIGTVIKLMLARGKRYAGRRVGTKVKGIKKWKLVVTK